MLLGCFSTLLIPETKRKTLEELAGEDDYAAGSNVYREQTSIAEGGGVTVEPKRGETPDS